MCGKTCFITDKLKQPINDSLAKMNIKDYFLEILKGLERCVGVRRRRKVQVLISKAGCAAIFMKASVWEQGKQTGEGMIS